MKRGFSFARQEHELAQSLVDFRNRYLAANDTARSAARDYVNSLADLAERIHEMTALPSHEILLYSAGMAPKGDDVVLVQVPVKVLKRAIAAWDKGEDYLLDTFADILQLDG